LNPSPCAGCVKRRIPCQKRLDRSKGCEKCHSSKLGCSLIGRTTKSKKSKESKAAAEPDTSAKSKIPRRKSGRLDRTDVKLVEIIGENMEPMFSYLEETRLARAQMAAIKVEAARVANALEDIAGLLRAKWSGEPAKNSGVETEVAIAVEEKSEVRTQASAPEESGSSDSSSEDDDEDDDRSVGEKGEDKPENDGGDGDVEMLEPLTSGPIGIIGDPIAGPSSSAS
jgi:hypothetical protein